jgi:putative spermidine/putrescine transport system permease protein
MARFPASLGTAAGYGVVPPSGITWATDRRRQVVARVLLGLLKWIALAALAVFILGPLIVMAIWAFAGQWTGNSLLPQIWSLKWWPDVLNLTGIVDAIKLSLETATVVMVCSSILCLPAAYAFARLRFAGRQPLLLAFLAANAFPKFGLYVTILTIFYKINFNDTVQGIVVIQMIETLVFMIWIPATAFQNIDRSLEEAAMDAGCSRIGTFFRITLPLAAPAIAVAMLLSFVAALDESQGTLIVGLPDNVTMPLIMYNAVNSYAQPEGAVFALILSVPSLLLLGVAQYLARGGGIRILGAT